MAFEQEKNQAPTPRRREKAREEGQFVKSQDLMGFAVLIAGTAALIASFGLTSSHVVDLTLHLLGDLSRPLDTRVATKFATTYAVSLAPLMVAVVIAAIGVGLLQVGPYLNFNKITSLNFQFLNLPKGLKRIMGSVESLIQVIFSSFKILVIGGICFYTLADWIFEFLAQEPTTLMTVLRSAAPVLVTLLVRLGVAVGVISLLDWCIKKYQHEQKLKMSIQEIKDENKQSEGNPEVRMARKRKQQELVEQRSIQNVPQADVVVVNPTHYAVALAYRSGEMESPKVIAKGTDLLAARIRVAARRAGVPILPRPPLARALCRRVKVGQSIPEDLFQAVAVVLAYVYRLRGRRGMA